MDKPDTDNVRFCMLFFSIFAPIVQSTMNSEKEKQLEEIFKEIEDKYK